jgi:hypothetical protein
MTGKDGKEKDPAVMGMSPIMEFTADGIVKAGMDISGLSEEISKLPDKNKENVEKLAEVKQFGKYKVSGDTIEFFDLEGYGDSPFGKDKQGTLKFEGDTLTLTGPKNSMKFTRMK